jgi:hypothetical protein
MRRWVPALLALLALSLALVAPALIPSTAQADSGGATISGLPESSSVQVFAEVSHTCYTGQPCDWFATAAAYSASSGCPDVFDATHGAWQSPIEIYGIKTVGNFALDPFGLGRTVVVCLYVYSEGSFSLVGQSHPFDRVTGREILPPPPGPPPSPEASLDGLRQCERPNRVGAFLAASPSVSCRTAGVVRARLFGRGYFSTRSTPCENRTYCVVMGFRCYGRYAGRLRPFSYTHHASCRAGHRRIVVDIG